MSLEQAVFLGGIAHLGILGAGIVMTKVLNWKTELKKLDQLTQHIIWTHGGYVWLTILAFGLVSVLFPNELIASRPLGPAISAFIALFWGIRLIIQLFYFNARPYLTDWKLKIGYYGLTVCFLYFTAVYGAAGIKGLHI
jgi:hypothetical protein